MKIKTNSNLTTGVLFLIVSAVFYLLIPLQIATRETTSVTAQTVPRAMIILIFLFSAVLIVQGLRGEKKTYVFDAAFFRGGAFRAELRTLLFIGILLAYALLFTHAGFLIATLLLTNGVLAYFGARRWYFYLIASANVFLVYFIFKVLLHVKLP